MLSKKPWLIEYVLMFIGALIMSYVCTGLLVMTLLKAKITGFKDEDDFGVMLCGTLGIQGLTCGLIPVFLKLHDLGWREAFGLNRAGWPKSLLLAAGVLVPALPLVLLLQQLCVITLTKLGHPPENERAVSMFLATTTSWTRAYFIFFAIILAPIAEEFIFRGILYPFIKQLGFPRLAFVGVSALFALFHLDLATFIPLFALALLLTWLYEKTDCLLASITAHSLFNTFNVALLLFLPQINDFIEKTFHVQMSQ